MEYTNKSIFMCTYVFEIDISTKHIRSVYNKSVSGIIAKGKGIEGIKKDIRDKIQY